MQRHKGSLAAIAAAHALTVAQGATPVAGAGVTGKLGTSTRADGALQVAINDLPLYFHVRESPPETLPVKASVQPAGWRTDREHLK